MDVKKDNSKRGRATFEGDEVLFLIEWLERFFVIIFYLKQVIHAKEPKKKIAKVKRTVHHRTEWSKASSAVYHNLKIYK